MENKKNYTSPYDLDGKIPFGQALALGLQHVLAMFVGNLTPILLITGPLYCDLEHGIQIAIIQNAMLIAGLVTLVQLFTIGPVGAKLPIVMGTSSGFIGVAQSISQIMGGGVLAYGALMGASLIGGLFECVLGFCIKPLRRFFPSVVTGTVVMSIGLSLIAVGINSFGGGNTNGRFRLSAESFRGYGSAGGYYPAEALYEGDYQHGVDSVRHHHRLYSLCGDGIDFADYLYDDRCKDRGRSCKDLLLGAELGQRRFRRMVRCSEPDAGPHGI